MARWLVIAAAVLATASQAGTASAQGARAGAGAQTTPLDRNQPVAFTADDFTYDRAAGIVTATGHVEAWQNDHVLRADKITFDRNTNVAAASGNVVVVEPDGQVLFADYAELTQGMREGVLRGMRAILAENGKLVANGSRRVDGKVNEMSHAVYTTCNLCKTDPSKPPLWQLRAVSAVQDAENQRIEYENAVLDIYGVPVAYLPYFSHPDPSAKRASGFLVPGLGQDSHLGEFIRVPYYWAIDPNQDVTITPEVASRGGEQVTADYRRRFNNGRLLVDLGGAEYKDSVTHGTSPQGFIFAKGNFSYDDTWRYGFNIQRTSSTRYLADFHVENYASVLASSAFIEGFGVGAYTKLDVLAYQGLATTINQSKLPYVLPRYEYSFFSEPDLLGGRWRFDTTDFNVVRNQGVNTQRASASVDWQRPFAGDLGEQYRVQVHLDSAAYSATSLDQQPTYGTDGSVETARAQPTLAADMRWPFMRDGGWSGSQVVEPIVQLIAAPNAGSYMHRNIPNEDSVDFEFTDSNLFAINRFPGIDRFEGGLRANAGVHGTWSIDNTTIDALVGQSYREHLDKSLPLLSGLNHHVSDVVGRVTVTPAQYYDLTVRGRVDPRNGDIRFAESQVSAGVPLFRLGVGYIYSATNPYFLFDQSPATVPPTGYPASYFTPRNEITLSASSQYGAYRFSGYARRDLELGKMVSVGAKAAYEDECFIFDVNFAKRYTSIGGDNGNTTVLFEITLKTVGQFGFHAS